MSTRKPREQGVELADVETLEAAAGRMCISISTIRRLIDQGQLESQRVLGRKVVRKADVDVLIERCMEIGRF